MSDDDSTTTRRTALKLLGTAGAVAVGGATVLSGSGAAAQGTLDISDATFSGDQGDITSVGVTLDHTATWDGFDIPVEAVEYLDELVVSDSNGNELGTHVLRDGTDTPVLLSNFSSQGDGSDGFGGSDEYTSGPGTQGDVNAGIDWTIIHEDPGSADNPPAGGTPADGDSLGLDNPDDGTDAVYTVELTKTVYFYTTQGTGSASTTLTTDDGTTVRPMGSDDGTVEFTEATGTFTVTVTNEGSTDDGSGSGTSSTS